MGISPTRFGDGKLIKICQSPAWHAGEGGASNGGRATHDGCRAAVGADGGRPPVVHLAPVGPSRTLIVVEQTASGFSAYAPEVLGCVATGPTRDAVERTMHEAIEFHVEGLRAEGLAVPEPHAYATVVEVAA